jgi:large subunit ribosomal protein L18e
VRKLRSPNPELINMVHFLKKQSKENSAPIWLDIAGRLTKPRRQRVAINVSHLNRYTEKNQTVVVPGKVLGTGVIDHALTIAALAFSSKAREKIGAANGKCLSFSEVVKKNPKGSKIKIIG